MNLYFNLQVDCESTQSSINNRELGENAVNGISDILLNADCRATYVVIPKDLKGNAGLYRNLANEGHEIGLHIHPKEEGWSEFLGIYGSKEQGEIINYGKMVFEDVMGFLPRAFTPGYFSANDYTFPILEELGFTCGSVSAPARDLPQCACVWGKSPRYVHYPHRFNRCLEGNVDFVDVPVTCDTESRMWGGYIPLELRVELVDAKNHYYTIEKAINHQLTLITSETGRDGEPYSSEKVAAPILYIKALTHNIFDYSNPDNFRRQTLENMVDMTKELAEKHKLTFTPATTGEIAEAFRKQYPLPEGPPSLELDQRGRKGWSK